MQKVALLALRSCSFYSVWLQVTNQMVKACKGYLTEEGLFRVWDQDRVEIISRIHDCLNLNRAYQDAFQRTKKRMEETPGEKPFDFSQLYIFGKFEAFCRRLEKVRVSYSCVFVIVYTLLSSGIVIVKRETRLDRNEMSMIRWVCRFALKGRKKNTNLRELMVLEPVSKEDADLVKQRTIMEIVAYL